MAITKVRQSTESVCLFSSGGVWSPSTNTLTGVAAGNLVLSLGAWWDSNRGTGAAQGIPTDSNGTLLGAGAANPNLPSAGNPPGWPVAPQIAHILSAAAGNHVLTPPVINSGGDGWHFGVEFNESGANWSLVDSGVAFSGSNTPGAVQSLTVSTAGTSAQPGDLVVAGIAIDGNPSAFGIGPASGYTNLLTTTTTTDNITAGWGWIVAASGGTQSASWAWTDTATQMAHAVIAVYRSNAGPTLTRQPADQMRPDGGSAQFEVAATGTGGLTYQWKRNGTNITGAVNPVYVRGSLTVADSGTYTCAVTDTIGTTTSAGASLTVFPVRSPALRFPLGNRTRGVRATPGGMRGLPGAGYVTLISEVAAEAYTNAGISNPSLPWLSTLFGGGGGTTYNDTLTEAQPVTDSLAVSLVIGVTRAEAQPVTDAVSSAAVWGATLAEAQPVTDTYASAALWVVTRAEAQPVTDALTALAVMSSALNEAVTVTDSLSSIGTFSVTLSESVALSDVVTDGATSSYSVSLIEAIGGDGPVPLPWLGSLFVAGGLSDSFTVGLVMPATLSDAQPVTDAVAGVIGIGGTLAEAQPVTDALAVAALRNPSLAESVAVTESLASTAVWAATYSASIALSEVISIAMVAGVSLAEAVTLADSVAAPAGGFFSVTISESIPLVDAFAATITATIIWVDQTVVTATWTPQSTAAATWTEQATSASPWSPANP